MSRNRRSLEDIAPDDFLETWGASTYEEALAKAEEAPTTTPPEEVKRCPECHSQRVYPRDTDTSDGPPRDYDTAYVCANRHHFDNPVYGDPAEADDDGVELAESDESDDDPFEWVDPDDLAEPPISRQLKQLDDRTLTALAIFLYAPWEDGGPSYRELSFVFPYSRQWIGERIRAWRDGEFRDLVADPRPWRVDE